MAAHIRCPVCDYDMAAQSSRKERSSLGKMYEVTRFRCKRDDVWVSLEIPESTNQN